MKNGKWREHISCFFYLIAFFAFLGGITTESSGSMLDFSSLARALCCVFAVVCVIAGAIIWKAKDARGRKIKIGIMVGALLVIIVGGIIDSKTDNTAAVEYDLSSAGKLVVSETVEKGEVFPYKIGVSAENSVQVELVVTD